MPLAGSVDNLNGRLPTDNSPINGTILSVPALKLSSPVSQSSSLGSNLLVGHKEILRKKLGKTVLYYAHNGTDLFGSLYTLKKGNTVTVTSQGATTDYAVSRIVHLSQDTDLEALNTGDSVVLVTCSWTNPSKRIAVFAN